MTGSFDDLRPLLFSIAYRMVGNVSEAEDLVQDAFLRYHRAVSHGTEVESPKAYLAAAITRLAIDHLRSARAHRESYFGVWLPEPLATDAAPEPAERAELADSLSLAFLTLLERVSPVERAVFLLREVFGYPYDEIAEIVGKSEDNCRQLNARAHQHIGDRRARFEASRERREELTDRFVAACQTGDVAGLVGLLAEDAIAYADGGGKVKAVPNAIYGPDKVARLLVGIMRPERAPEPFTLRSMEVNGTPARLAINSAGEPIGVLALDIAVDGLVHAVHVIVNPDKLHHLDVLK